MNRTKPEKYFKQRYAALKQHHAETDDFHATSISLSAR